MLLRTTRHTGRKPWLPSIATAHQWEELSLQLWPKKHNYSSLSSFFEHPASTPQTATLWEPCWDCLWAVAQELWMDHSGISRWASCCGSPARSVRAVGSTILTQSRLSCVQHFCHTDQLSWHGVWASQYLWSETAWQTPSHEARQCKAIAHHSFFHWEKWFYVRPMLCIMQLCRFWLDRQSHISGSSVSWNCG